MTLLAEDESTVRKCELCDEPGVRMTKDELGNDCWVCLEHYTLLVTVPHDPEWFEAQKGEVR